MILLFVGVVLCAVAWWLVYLSLDAIVEPEETIFGALAILFMVLGLALVLFGLGVV